MVKLVVLFGHPEDTRHFHDYYENKHMPLVHRMPGIKRIESGKVVDSPLAESLPYYFIAEYWFDDMASLRASMATSAGKTTAADTDNFATGGWTLVIQEVD